MISRVRAAPKALAGCAAAIILAAVSAAPARANTYLLPPEGDNVVGQVGFVSATQADTISDIARTYDQGFDEMRDANPKVDPWLPGKGTKVRIPSEYILPDTPHKGIVINVPEMRLYYYPRPAPGEHPVVVTHPISVGRQNWATPKGLTRIVSKKANPAWYPPASIRKEHAENGDPLARVIPAGPDNPLGLFAMKLGLPGYLIHGTNKPYGVGMRVSHGCIRLYPEDIEELFHQVPVGTPVRIINRPYKVGWREGTLYVEVHPHLKEDKEQFRDVFTQIMELIIKAADGRKVDVQWSKLQAAVSKESGVPVAIGRLAQAPVQAMPVADASKPRTMARQWLGL